MQGSEEVAVILVDGADRELGTAPRAACHAPGGRLHRAFSVYLFDARGALLLQQRSAEKPLWPGYWSNSCCSHPRPDEDVRAAARRRVREELGLEARLTPLFRYEYRADFGAVGTEHELVHVLVGAVDPRAVCADASEVAAWRMAPAEVLDAALAADEARAPGGPYTPWFRLAWPELRGRHRAAVDAAVARA